MQSLAARNLKAARERMKRFADRKRIKGPELKIGDLVLLNRTSIKSKKDFPQMDLPFMGSFRVINVVSDVAVKLGLPTGCHLHPLFHISQLEKFKERTEGPKQRLPADSIPDDIVADPSMELVPTAILDSRVDYGKKQYLVRAANCSHENDTWADQQLVPPILIQKVVQCEQKIPWDRSSPEFRELLYSTWQSNPLEISQPALRFILRFLLLIPLSELGLIGAQLFHQRRSLGVRPVCWRSLGEK